MTPAYPLSAIVGQEDLVEALLVNAVDPQVGGVLVRGERGTAKTTAVRALAPLLPPVTAAVDEPFAFAPGELAPGGAVAADAPVESRQVPLVELPLGATLDRLVGALDLARALAGEQAFESGLLARAHRGILYVDEINLLPDHLVDAMLDAAATGVARVERDAVSVTHDARFILVGTMNVEEGELRPQLLDRFGLSVEVRGSTDPAIRSEIVRRRLDYDRGPPGFAADWRRSEEAVAARIAGARAALPGVVLPERELFRITSACAQLGIDGARGDIVCARAARALAALDGTDTVSEEHVRRAAKVALAHRRRRDPLDDRQASEDELEQALAGDGPERDPEPDGDRPGGGVPPSSGEGAQAEPGAQSEFSPQAPARERTDPPVTASIPSAALKLSGSGSGPSGRRARSTGEGAGAIDSRAALPESDDVAIVATLRDRIVHGTDAPLREHIRSGREGLLLCLVVDASGSMGARRRLARVKGALLALLGEAYARRDRVAIVAFRDDQARIVVEPAAPIERAAAAIRVLPTGGRTPLAAGLHAAERLVRRERGRGTGWRPVAIVLTDGRVADEDGAIRRAARALSAAAAAVHVIDLEEGPMRLGLAGAIAEAAGGRAHVLGGAPPSSRRTAA